jgi:hypothetical protein
MPKLTVTRVKCRRESDSGSECEIYLKGEGAKVWPSGSYRSIAITLLNCGNRMILAPMTI